MSAEPLYPVRDQTTVAVYLLQQPPALSLMSGAAVPAHQGTFSGGLIGHREPVSRAAEGIPVSPFRFHSLIKEAGTQEPGEQESTPSQRIVGLKFRGPYTWSTEA